MIKRTTPSSLSERITLFAQSFLPDPMGGFSVQWTERETLWASIEKIEIKVSSLKLIDKYSGLNKGHHIFQLRFRYYYQIPVFQRILWHKDTYEVITNPALDRQKKWVDSYIQKIL